MAPSPLHRHRGLEGLIEALRLRAAYAARGGVEVDTQGDAFLYAFPEAAEAFAAAEEGQEALGEEAFTAAWARGEAMTPEEIVAFAGAGQAVRSAS
jgi:hypothetical protein